jgi:hypothetical protein
MRLLLLPVHKGYGKLLKKNWGVFLRLKNKIKKKSLREKCNCICVSGSYDGLKKFPLQPILSFGQQDLHNHQSWSLHFCKLASLAFTCT